MYNSDTFIREHLSCLNLICYINMAFTIWLLSQHTTGKEHSRRAYTCCSIAQTNFCLHLMEFVIAKIEELGEWHFLKNKLTVFGGKVF